MDKIALKLQERLVQTCIDFINGQIPSNVTVITSESYYEHESDNGDKHIAIRTRDVNKDSDNDKDLDYFYCQECGKKVYFSKKSMFMPHPNLCSFCESHDF